MQNGFKRFIQRVAGVSVNTAEASPLSNLTPADFSRLAVHTVSEELSRMGRGIGGGAGSQYDGLRQVEDVCGYKKELSWEDYWDTYDRFELAGRVVDAYPDATFAGKMRIVERDDTNVTPFEKDMQDLLRMQRVQGYLHRLDILAGIGNFGILLIGLDDGAGLNTPANKNRKNKITYLRPFHQGAVTISKWDEVKTSPRHGQPVEYKIKMLPPGTRTHGSAAIGSAEHAQSNPSDLIVHHTRVIHYADNLLDNDVFGTPRLHRVYNRLADVLKIVAGSAEMFWRGAYQGMAFEMDSDAQVDPAEKLAMRDNIEEYLKGLTRQILLQGTKAKSLAPNVSSPGTHFETCMTMVAIAAKMPQRILMGTEQGKLASSQDLRNWNRAVVTRRDVSAEPRLARALIDFCVEYQVVAKPEDGYLVLWPDLALPDEGEQAKIATLYTDALTKYVSGRIYRLMKFDEYLVRIWGFDIKAALSLAKDIDYAALIESEKAEQGGPSETRDVKKEYESRTRGDTKGDEA